jgi:integrase
MARKPSNHKLSTVAARKGLKVAHEPYWHESRRGLHIGYRQGTTGGTWWLREYRGGKLHKRRVGQADSEDVAADGVNVLTWEDVNRLAIDPERPTTQPLGDWKVEDALEEYFSHRTAKSPPESVAVDRSKADALIAPKLGSNTIDSLTTGDFLAWRNALVPETDDLEERRRAQATANRAWTILRAALNQAYRSERVASADAWRRVQPFKNVDRPGERFLSEAECKRLLNSCRPEFRALVRGALYTGCRLGELVRLKVADVIDGAVVVRHSKAGKMRRVPLSEEGAELFEQVTAGKTGDALVFPSPAGEAWSRIDVHRAMVAASKAANLAPAPTFRDLRRTYGSLLINKGAEGAVIQRLLGHADQRMTLRVYSHLLDKTIANVVKKKSPRFGLEVSKVRKLRP